MAAQLLPVNEITSHPLLDSSHRNLARVMRSRAKADGNAFSMIAFAKICLRATGRNYVEASAGEDEANTPAILADIEHRRAAILYAYEALKATDLAIIKEWPQFDEMLKCLEQLAAGELP